VSPLFYRPARREQLVPPVTARLYPGGPLIDEAVARTVVRCP